MPVFLRPLLFSDDHANSEDSEGCLEIWYDYANSEDLEGWPEVRDHDKNNSKRAIPLQILLVVGVVR